MQLTTRVSTWADSPATYVRASSVSSDHFPLVVGDRLQSIALCGDIVDHSEIVLKTEIMLLLTSRRSRGVETLSGMPFPRRCDVLLSSFRVVFIGAVSGIEISAAVRNLRA